MAKFTVRVELHHVAKREISYKTLHEAMERLGFSRTLVDSKGVERHLPEAEYFYTGKTTRKKVLKLAKEAVLETGKESSILVTESVGRRWHNLKPVEEQAD